MERIQSIIKWAGGKSKLVDQITSLFPASFERYIEPFMGSAAVALNIDCPTILTNDGNPDLACVWKTLQDNPEELIHQVGFLFSGQYNNETDYYQLRKEFNSRTSSNVRQAALFIYLNKHGYNGLCRYNRKGEFNVPFGRYNTVGFDPERLREVAKKIKDWLIFSGDYTHILMKAGKGDVVYCDPPYVTDAQVKAGFTAYSPNEFGLRQQKELALHAMKAAERGATVIISNHDTAFTRDLYVRYGGELVFLDVQRNISCKGTKRHKAKELLAVFRPK